LIHSADLEPSQRSPFNGEETPWESIFARVRLSLDIVGWKKFSAMEQNENRICAVELSRIRLMEIPNSFTYESIYGAMIIVIDKGEWKKEK
jgi:hypothetical protein